MLADKTSRNFNSCKFQTSAWFWVVRAAGYTVCYSAVGQLWTYTDFSLDAVGSSTGRVYGLRVKGISAFPRLWY